MPLQQLILADEPTELERALADLSDLDVVGVDVERADGQRYYRAAALIQVGGHGRVIVVDPLALPGLAALDEFLRGRTVVLHAMENDLPPLEALGVGTSDVEDTAVAAALLGLPVGLEGLLADVLGVELSGDKQAMQRADWEARPLDDAMLRYAAADVADLPELWADLAERLRSRGRLPWYREELEAIRSQPSVEERRDWSKTRGAGRLAPPARMRLRALWETRERLAQETDTAPARVLSDRVLIDLAASPPDRVGELGRRGMRRSSVRDFGPAIIAALALPQVAADLEQRAGRRPTDHDRAAAERLRVLRSQKAEELGIDPGVLCPGRRLISAVLADPATPQALRESLGLRSWQWDQLGGLFSEALGIDEAGNARERGNDSNGEDNMSDVLGSDALHASLDKLDGWSGTVDGIEKEYTFADFAEAMRFVNKVADLAEDADHHPDIDVRWNKVRLALSTHSAGGVTQNDVALAERIDGEPATAPGAT